MKSIDRVIRQAEDLLLIIRGKGVIAGSFALWIYKDWEWTPSDIDIFPFSEEDYVDIHAELSRVYTRTRDSNTAVTFSNPNEPLDVQLVFHDPERVDAQSTIESFDISVSQFALVGAGDLVHTDIAVKDADSNECRLVRDHNRCLVDLYRLMKYAKKGFRVFPSDFFYILEKYKDSEDDQEHARHYVKYSKVWREEHYDEIYRS